MRTERHDPVLCRGARIVLPLRAGGLANLAARELARYLYQLTGVVAPIVDRPPRAGTAILLGLDWARHVGVPLAEQDLRADGFVIQTGHRAGLAFVSIAAAQPRGLLYGVYALLEELGLGFYLGGDTFPDKPTQCRLPLGFRRVQNPQFKVRGSLLHDNTLIGITGWGESDYRAYFSQMARLRCNTVMLLWYCDHAAEVWHEERGRLINARPVMSSLTKPWGAVEALRTGQFYFGAGDFFDQEVFGHPALDTHRDPLAQRREIGRALSRAIAMAKANGVDVATGFVAPVGNVNQPADPTDRRVRDAFQRRVRRFLERNPDLAYFLLSNHESGGCSGTRLPADSPGARRLFEAQRPLFAYLGNARRVWEAIRFGHFAQLAWEVLRKDAPQVKLVLNGWGGDRWMRFADYCLGYDKLLPPDVIFSCHDSIESTLSDTVSAAWGELPPARERWAVPWIENDGSDFWTPQPNVPGLWALAADALRKGCQGLAVMTWRTRDFEEEVGFAARFAWEPDLSVERFYRRLARDAFGPAHAKRMAAHLQSLQRLGKRWTGVKGTPEISAMDLYWMHAHHLAHFAGAGAKMAELDRIADDLRGLRGVWVARHQLQRLERLDYLLANVDFVRHYDRVAMLLADGEAVEAAIRRGKHLLSRGRRTAARAVAGAAYRRLIAAGMREATLALTRKLSTRCEWGILATVNIKPIPRYFEFVGELEALMPAPPPPGACEAERRRSARVVGADGADGRGLPRLSPDRAKRADNPSDAAPVGAVAAGVR